VEDWACERVGNNAKLREKTRALQVKRETMSYIPPGTMEARYYAQVGVLSKVVRSKRSKQKRTR